MPGFDGSDKHCTMRDLLVELGVDDPSNDGFYTSGGEITKRGLEEALQAALGLKRQVRQLATNILEIVPPIARG